MMRFPTNASEETKWRPSEKQKKFNSDTHHKREDFAEKQTNR